MAERRYDRYSRGNDQGLAGETISRRGSLKGPFEEFGDLSLQESCDASELLSNMSIQETLRELNGAYFDYNQRYSFVSAQAIEGVTSDVLHEVAKEGVEGTFFAAAPRILGDLQDRRVREVLDKSPGVVNEMSQANNRRVCAAKGLVALLATDERFQDIILRHMENPDLDNLAFSRSIWREIMERVGEGGKLGIDPKSLMAARENVETTDQLKQALVTFGAAQVSQAQHIAMYAVCALEKHSFGPEERIQTLFRSVDSLGNFTYTRGDGVTNQSIFAAKSYGLEFLQSVVKDMEDGATIDEGGKLKLPLGGRLWGLKLGGRCPLQGGYTSDEVPDFLVGQANLVKELCGVDILPQTFVIDQESSEGYVNMAAVFMANTLLINYSTGALHASARDDLWGLTSDV